MIRSGNEMMNPEITAVIVRDMADVERAGVKKIPTYFVNGQLLPSFGVEQLYNLVRPNVEAVAGGKLAARGLKKKSAENVHTWPGG